MRTDSLPIRTQCLFDLERLSGVCVETVIVNMVLVVGICDSSIKGYICSHSFLLLPLFPSLFQYRADMDAKNRCSRLLRCRLPTRTKVGSGSRSKRQSDPTPISLPMRRKPTPTPMPGFVHPIVSFTYMLQEMSDVRSLSNPTPTHYDHQPDHEHVARSGYLCTRRHLLSGYRCPGA